MNDFSELEAELKQLRPSAASPELIARIASALEQEECVTPVIRPARFQVIRYAIGFGLAAAAALLFLARVKVEHAPKPAAAPIALTQPAASMQPDGVTRVVYNQSDEGLVFRPNSDEPLRRFRSRSREILRWKNPSTGPSLRVSYPTEDVELIPVSGQ